MGLYGNLTYGCPDLCTLYFKEEHLFIYDTLFIHKENWCP